MRAADMGKQRWKYVGGPHLAFEVFGLLLLRRVNYIETEDPDVRDVE